MSLPRYWLDRLSESILLGERSSRATEERLLLKNVTSYERICRYGRYDRWRQVQKKGCQQF